MLHGTGKLDRPSPSTKDVELVSDEVTAMSSSWSWDSVRFQVWPVVRTRGANVEHQHTSPLGSDDPSHGYLSRGWYHPIGDEKIDALPPPAPAAGDDVGADAAPPANTTGPVIPPISETGSPEEASIELRNTLRRNLASLELKHAFAGASKIGRGQRPERTARVNRVAATRAWRRPAVVCGVERPPVGFQGGVTLCELDKGRGDRIQ